MCDFYADFLQENKLHGSPDYPIEHYVCQIPYTYHFLPTHWHVEFEVTLVHSGSLTYTIGNESNVVSEGDILFIPPYTLHSASHIDDTQAETHTVVFHLNLLGLGINDRCTERFIEPIQTGGCNFPSIITPTHPSYEKILDCFNELWSYSDPQNGEELLVKSVLYKLMYQIHHISMEEKNNNQDTDFLRNAEKIRPVLSYIHEHYTEPLTIEELASVCGFSPVHFMNIFKKVIGSSCIEYIIAYRVSMSTRNLKETDAPILKIAMDHGFQNISYYNRTFRRKLGMTPTEYRKLHRSVSS